MPHWVVLTHILLTNIAENEQDTIAEQTATAYQCAIDDTCYCNAQHPGCIQRDCRASSKRCDNDLWAVDNSPRLC